MASALFRTLHPAVYHGASRQPPFFEGWYTRLVSADETTRLAVIAGVILGPSGHAFVQVLDGVKASSTYHQFPLSDFWASDREFKVRIGGNTFGLDGISLDLPGAAGQLVVHDPQPWPVTLASPGIMGWYAWVPGMECYHGVLSFNHRLSGALRLQARTVNFEGGRGYMEKDWGAAFPEAYVWMQTNHFEQEGICLTASIAIIPWMRSAFPGQIIGLWIHGKLYRFATYTGARLERLALSDRQVDWLVRDRRYRLEIHAVGADAGLLKGPTRLEMGKRISETLQGRVQVRLSALQGQTLFEGLGRHAGLEVFQGPGLLKMLGGGGSGEGPGLDPSQGGEQVLRP